MQYLVYKGLKMAVGAMIHDPMDATGEPIDLSWADAGGEAGQLISHAAVVNLAALHQLVARLGTCFDRSLSAGQVDVLVTRVERLREKQEFCLHFAVRHQQEVTNLEITVGRADALQYVIGFRGQGAAMAQLKQEIHQLLPPAKEDTAKTTETL